MVLLARHQLQEFESGKFLCELICLLMNEQSGESTGRVANRDLTQMNDLQLIRLITYNYFGWNNGKECCLDLLSSKNVDFLLIQEHWLFDQQFCQLMINDDYLFTTICGMASDAPLIGRPYGGYCIFYKESLAGCISICSTGFKRVNAIVVQLVDGQLLLIANVYFLQMMDGKVNLNDTLGEIEGLLASQQFDYLLVAGDFNTDISPKTTFSKALLDFADYHSLVLADVQFGDSVGWTFESHCGLSHSWIDHILVSSRIVSAVSEVSTLDCVSNFSDHRPILAVCQLHLVGMNTHIDRPTKRKTLCGTKPLMRICNGILN